MVRGAQDDEEPENVSPYVIKVKASAAKDFAALPSHVAKRFDEAMQKMERNPFRRRSGVDLKPLEGSSAWRLRVGGYRGVYEVEGKVVTFTHFEVRGRVY